MTFRKTGSTITLSISLAVSVFTAAQNKTTQDSAPSTPVVINSDYPNYSSGILIRGSDWISIPAEAPAKSHLKHGLAPTFTYGIASAQAASDYQGEHAAITVEPGRPVICICHVLSLPGDPALVILHPKKDFRELDTGKLHVRGKIAQAEAADLVPADVSNPDKGVWLVQPRQPLKSGEYALMLGTQNISIFPFTVAAGNPSSGAPTGR